MKNDHTEYQEFPIDNYFGLPIVEQLHCHIKEFSTSLSNLLIGVKGTDKDGKQYYFEIVFIGTRLLNAPKEWISANFQLESPARCITELRTLPHFDGVPDDELSLYKMFSITLERREVIIIAGDANLLTPSQLRQKYGR